ncbi:MAG TPA: efflux RND transporter periplasmic adaptor subunit [Tepidisphaeraceae bacterium]|nr:efflux RND transporter periplasmic adaptor subunit [Tepidisphaeraceae bacterium]
MPPHEETKVRSGNGDPIDSDILRPVHHPPGPSRIGAKLAIGVVLMAIILTAAFLYVHHQRAVHEADLAAQANQDSTTAPTVDVVPVTPSASVIPLTLPGDTTGWYQSTIYARVNGYIQKWFSDIGDRVHKGQVLAVIETPDLDAQLESAKSELAVAGSQVQVIQANVDFAKSTYDRWSQSPKGVVSEQETTEKKAEYDSGLAQLKAAQSKVDADQSNVDQLQALEAYKQVTAPYDGVITARDIDIGDLVTAGSTSNTTPLYRIAQSDVIRVFVDVPQNASGGIADGLTAVASTGDDAVRRFTGKVARSSRAIDPVSRTMRVEVDVPNPDLLLLPGTYLSVTFDLRQKPLLEVPASALIFRAAGPQVAVVDSDGTVNFHNVTIAHDEGQSVEVGTGLSPGDKVALNISNQISDGDHVQAKDISQPPTTASADH